ncbi:MAG: PstS family phosphate ABC transporter substrate-binding protein, partial [Anaerolineales bacterium]|nr:PstS family phosphate ABC transporter substrate-binding protein [Anaerolineales bacterium]
STGDIMQAKPQVAAYINFFLTYVNEEVVDVGYFPASTTALNAAKAAWTVGMTSGGAEMTASGIMLPAVDPLSVSGEVVTAGSSTVFPLAERMAERFQDEGFAGNVTIDSIGSGAGFERFCVAGETDVANASRPIKDSEIESCQGIGREPIEFRVGTDALAVVVSAENDFLTNASLADLAAIFSTAETWADVNPDWPAEPILRYIPGTDSGTFDYFVEVVFEEDEEPILAASNLELSEDDNVLVQGILGSPYAIGFFGYAYYQENADALHILSVEGIEPNAENVDNASYPLARPLFIYSTGDIMQAKPQVAAYINFFLTYVNEEVVDVGYFPASEDALNLAKLSWLNANN